MPFAGYSSFEDCRSKNRDKNDPDAYCGSIKHKVEDKAVTAVNLSGDVLNLFGFGGGNKNPTQRPGFQQFKPKAPAAQPKAPAANQVGGNPRGPGPTSPKPRASFQHNPWAFKAMQLAKSVEVSLRG